MDTNILDLYTDYLICQNKYATATGMSDMLCGEISHDKITRFLRSKDLGSKELWEYTKSMVHQNEKSGGVLIFDDAIEEKPYTDENNVNCWHYSHAKGCVLKGLNLLSCMVRYDDLSLPIGYEIIKKEIQYCDLKTRRVRRRSDVTKNQLFRQLIQQACDNNVSFDYVLADNWYGSKAFPSQYSLSKKFSKTKTEALEFSILSPTICTSMLNVFMRFTKNGGELKSIISQLSKILA